MQTRFSPAAIWRRSRQIAAGRVFRFRLPGVTPASLSLVGSPQAICDHRSAVLILRVEQSNSRRAQTMDGFDRTMACCSSLGDQAFGFAEVEPCHVANVRSNDQISSVVQMASHQSLADVVDSHHHFERRVALVDPRVVLSHVDGDRQVAGIGLATSVGIDSITPMSDNNMSPQRTGGKMPGIDADARTASRSGPCSKTTRCPVNKSTATILSGIGKSCNLHVRQQVLDRLLKRILRNQ